jgi:hypothetical protein
VVVVVLGALLLSAGAAFAQVYGGYGAPGQETKPYIRAKVGWFQPNDSDLDGSIAFGLDYVVPAQQAYVSVDRLHADSTGVESTTWSLMGGMYRTVEYSKHQFYYGAGIGIAREKLERVSLGDENTSRFAWEIGGGVLIGRNGFGEIHYRDGGSDGNRGPLLCLGVSY